MKFIPSRNFTIYSCLSFNEVKDTLKNQNAGSIFDKRQSPFISTIDDEQFAIYKTSSHRNNFNSVTIGTKDSSDDHIIHIEQRFHPFTLIFFYIECLIGFSLLVAAIALTIFVPQSLFMDLMFLPLVALCVLAGCIAQNSFNHQADYTKKELLKLIKAVQVNKEITPLTEENLIF